MWKKSDLELIVDATLKEIALALYRQKKISLAKAASIAGVSLTRMKEILLEKGVKPRLGVEGLRELERDYETLKETQNTIKFLLEDNT